MFILKGVLRAESQERILLYLLVRETGYASEIASFFCTSNNPIQQQINKLEEDGVVISQSIGRTKEYRLNPRYPFYSSLKEMLKAALKAYPKQVRTDLLIVRGRPRKSGKKLINA
jgi:predicted transcriptional regulator